MTRKILNTRLNSIASLLTECIFNSNSDKYQTSNMYYIVVHSQPSAYFCNASLAF